MRLLIFAAWALSALAVEVDLPVNVKKNFGIEVGRAKVLNGQLILPIGSLVHSLDRYMVFRMDGNHAFAEEVILISKTRDEAVLRMNKQLMQAEIVVKGANFVQTMALTNEEGPGSHEH